MTYVNSEYNYDNEVSKASCIFASWTVNIFDSVLPSFCVYTCVLFCFLVMLITWLIPRFLLKL